MATLKTPLVVFLSFLFGFSLVHAQGVFTPRLEDAVRRADPGATILSLVTFADKGKTGLSASASPGSLVSPRALARRTIVLPSDRLVDETDLPVNPEYLHEVASTGAVVRHALKWFNAVSVLATTEQLRKIAALPGVASLDIVGQYRREHTVETFAPAATVGALSKTTTSGDINYGDSFNALNMLSVPAVHGTGNHAQGILIGVFDNGFRLLTHTVFDSLRPRIVATRDFVDHKTSVVPNNPNSGFGSHGVWTLATIGGYAPGHVVGPAFGASFVLARTENDSSETPIEEDNWAAAIEWAESLGVQVTSTSLGYLAFDAPYVSWTWQNMDGRTTLITRAAAMAVRKGVVVVNSAGNNGNNASHNTLNAPADADSVIAAGAVNPDGNRAGFSSVGPTTSIPPHIKPDVMAQGQEIAVPSAVNDTAWGLQQGTSFSCPLIAGVAALMLKAHPTATPYDIMTWLKATASNASSPNNLIGWGIADAEAAIAYPDLEIPAGVVLSPCYPNPFNGGTTLRYLLPEPSRVTVKIFDVLGQLVRVFPSLDVSATTGVVDWDGTAANGRLAATGAYFFRVEATGVSGQTRTSTAKALLLR
jgi:serine protease AprX